MSPLSRSPDPPSSPLAHRVGEGAGEAAIAEAIADVWRNVDVALRPIVGQRGVVALFNRSVHLSAEVHPWLTAGRHDPEVPLDTEPLRALFSQQTAAQALAGGSRLLSTFHELLVSLIGTGLTERLLRAAWAPPLHGHSAQDPSS